MHVCERASTCKHAGTYYVCERVGTCMSVQASEQCVCVRERAIVIMHSHVFECVKKII